MQSDLCKSRLQKLIEQSRLFPRKRRGNYHSTLQQVFRVTAEWNNRDRARDPVSKENIEQRFLNPGVAGGGEIIVPDDMNYFRRVTACGQHNECGAPERSATFRIFHCSDHESPGSRIPLATGGVYGHMAAPIEKLFLQTARNNASTSR